MMQKYDLNEWLSEKIQQMGFDENISEKIVLGLSFLLVFLVFFLLNCIVKKLIPKFEKIVKKTKFKWDDFLYEKGLLQKITYLIPLIITQKFIELLFSHFDILNAICQKIINIWLLILILGILQKIIGILSKINKKDNHFSVAIEGAVQIIKISLYVLGAILLFSILLDIPLKIIFTSLGAVMAILILIFKDTILGFISGMQIAFSKTIKVGDWITLPAHKIDGNVLDIGLFSAKVENWDKTISSIPTAALVNSSVKNWKAMEESKVRRIKVQFILDANTIKFCKESDLEKIKKYELLNAYILQKQKEIKKYNDKIKANKNFFINGRHLTNIGLLRSYAEFYLQNHPKIDENQTLIVRLLEPTSEGIPMEIYCFSNDTNWKNYEKIQSDIMDHLLSCVAYFDLKIFQLTTFKK